MRNTGFDYLREQREQSDKDYKFGSITEAKVCLTNISLSVRGFYLPIGEVQKGQQDFTDCATRGVINILETKFNWLLRNNKLKNVQWLSDNGYIVEHNGQKYIEFSDRFVAINSGTTQEGNSLKAPIESIRKQGLIPKSILPAKKEMTWKDYHNRNDITSEMIELGKTFTDLYTIEYDFVEPEQIEKALENNLIDTAGYAWPMPINLVYPATDLPFNHCFILWKPKYYAFDNYPDNPSDGEWIKLLSKDYKFYRGYRINIVAENTPEIVEKQKSILIKIIDIAKKVIGLLGLLKEEQKKIIIPQAIESLKWSTPEEARHSARVIMDEYKLKWAEKDLLCAVIMAESGFKITAHNSQTDDWGICQINRKYWIGESKTFENVEEVLNFPEKSIRFMVMMFLVGKLGLWVAFKNKSYLKYLPK